MCLCSQVVYIVKKFNVQLSYWIIECESYFYIKQLKAKFCLSLLLVKNHYLCNVIEVCSIASVLYVETEHNFLQLLKLYL